MNHNIGSIGMAQEAGFPISVLASQNGGGSANAVIKRTLCVQISGSLANLALAGPQAAMWKSAGGKETELFCPSLDGDMDPAEMTNAIRNGIIRSVAVQEQRSTFPCTLGVSLSCLQPTEVTDIGDKYAYTVLPHSNTSSPQTIYSCDASAQENSTWRQQYGKWNKNNLESEGTMEVPGAPYIFVDQEHPAVALLRHNADLIGCDIDKQPKMDNKWFKITRQVMSTCCQTLRAKVLNKVRTQDLNMFSLQLHRVNASAWDDLGDGMVAFQGFKTKAKWSEEQLEKEKEHHLRQFVTTPYQYIARVQVEYEIPSATAAAA
jgi:hypothetical protein